MGQLRLALLGAPLVHHADREIAFPTRKVLALLVYLAVEGGLHGREQLVALLWPESNQDAGRTTLRSSLARLRDALVGNVDEAPHLRSERDLVGLDVAADHQTDLQVLQAAWRLAHTHQGSPTQQASAAALAELQQAAAACRGEFLQGFSVRDAPEFDAWTTLQRQRWQPVMEDVLDGLSQLQASGGIVASALETASRWVALNPLSEAAYRRLMELHLASGDPASALRAYDRCRAVLAQELSIAPAPETEAMAEHLRTTPPQRITTAGAPRAGSFSLPALLEGPLVGRTAQFDKLVELHHVTRSGRARVAVVQGESGIGKTRLAEDFLRWTAAHGADALRGRAFETGGRLPYQPLVDALRPRVERENAPDDLLSDVWLAELTRLLPELRERYPDLPIPAGDEAAARTRLFEAVVRLGQALAERAPLVLFIDDVQWADAASRDLVHYMARRWTAGGSSILVVLSMRSEALTATPALGEWLLGLERDTECVRLTLDSLSADDVLTFVAGLAGTASRNRDVHVFAQWLYRETNGQPFFVVETLKALLERGALAPRLNDEQAWVIELEPSARDAAAWRGFLPPGVREVIRARLRWLNPTAQGLVAAAAVLGQGFNFEQLCRVADVMERDGLSALDEIVRGRLLREEAAGAYLFTHDKIRDVAYAEAGEARRRVFHRRALEVLQESAAPAAELARHALAVGLLEPAFEFSSIAGDQALRLLAARDAIAYYEQAMSLAERLGRRDVLPTLHARRGRALASITRWPEARHDFEDALPELAGEERVAALVELAMVCNWLFDVPSTRLYAGEALALSQALGRDDLAAGAIGVLALADSADGELAGSLDRYRQAFVRAGAQPPAAMAPAAEMSALILYWTGHYADAIARAKEAIEIARTVNDTSNMIRALSDLGMALGASGQYKAALETFEQARRSGQEYGVETWMARAISMRGGLHLDVFDFKGAETLAEEARELGRSLNFLHSVVSGGIDLLLTFARRGDVGRTERLIDEVAQAARNASGSHGWLWRLRLTQARAEIALARADWETACRWAADTVEQSVRRGRPKYEALARATRGQALAQRGDLVQALVDVRAAVTVARTAGDPALLLRTAALLLALEGNDDLLAESRSAVEQIARSLPETGLRQRFAAAEPVRMVARLTPWSIFPSN